MDLKAGKREECPPDRLCPFGGTPCRGALCGIWVESVSASEKFRAWPGRCAMLAVGEAAMWEAAER